MEVGLSSSPLCLAASQAAFLFSQQAFRGPPVSTVWRREERCVKVNSEQLSVRSGLVEDGLWVSSPVWMGSLIESEEENHLSLSVDRCQTT